MHILLLCACRYACSARSMQNSMGSVSARRHTHARELLHDEAAPGSGLLLLGRGCSRLRRRGGRHQGAAALEGLPSLIASTGRGRGLLQWRQRCRRRLLLVGRRLESGPARFLRPSCLCAPWRMPGSPSAPVQRTHSSARKLLYCWHFRGVLVYLRRLQRRSNCCYRLLQAPPQQS